MSKFLLLLRGGDFQSYSEKEMQEIVGKYMAWSDKLRSENRLVASEELKNDGRVLSVKNSQVIDGPYTETKEAVGGFYLIEAKDYDEASQIAKECPHLEFNGNVEIREINPH